MQLLVLTGESLAIISCIFSKQVWCTSPWYVFVLRAIRSHLKPMFYYFRLIFVVDADFIEIACHDDQIDVGAGSENFDWLVPCSFVQHQCGFATIAKYMTIWWTFFAGVRGRQDSLLWNMFWFSEAATTSSEVSWQHNDTHNNVIWAAVFLCWHDAVQRTRRKEKPEIVSRTWPKQANLFVFFFTSHTFVRLRPQLKPQTIVL